MDESHGHFFCSEPISVSAEFLVGSFVLYRIVGFL